MVPPDSHRVSRVPWYSGYHFPPNTTLRLRASHALWDGFPAVFNWVLSGFGGVPRPRTQKVRFRLFGGRSPLLPESRLFSLPRRTKMFQFRRCPPARLWIHRAVTPHQEGRVSPFGFPRIKACLQLPVAFRRWPRPSSARCPKASTMRPYSASQFLNPGKSKKAQS